MLRVGPVLELDGVEVTEDLKVFCKPVSFEVLPDDKFDGLVVFNKDVEIAYYPLDFTYTGELIAKFVMNFNKDDNVIFKIN